MAETEQFLDLLERLRQVQERNDSLVKALAQAREELFIMRERAIDERNEKDKLLIGTKTYRKVINFLSSIYGLFKAIRRK